MMSPKKLQDLKEQVKLGGGEWVGIQEVCLGEDLVLFNMPKVGTTLALKISDCSAVRVRNALKSKEAEYARIR